MKYITFLSSVFLCTVIKVYGNPHKHKQIYNNIAIIIGINDYKHARDVIGAKEAAISFRDSLIIRGKNWVTGNGWGSIIYLFIDEAATYQRLQETICGAASSVSSEGVLLFCFFGHGGRYWGGGKWNYFICPYDVIPRDGQEVSGQVTTPPDNIILAEDLWRWVTVYPSTHKIVMIFESCMSGGMLIPMTKGVGISSSKHNEVSIARNFLPLFSVLFLILKQPL